jgi:hypothetical protein
MTSARQGRRPVADSAGRCAVTIPSSISVFHAVPRPRLTSRTVRSALVTASRLDASPASTSPFAAMAAADGVLGDPLRMRDNDRPVTLNGADLDFDDLELMPASRVIRSSPFT